MYELNLLRLNHLMSLFKVPRLTEGERWQIVSNVARGVCEGGADPGCVGRGGGEIQGGGR